jgi:hypothetical protein
MSYTAKAIGKCDLGGELEFLPTRRFLERYPSLRAPMTWEIE